MSGRLVTVFFGLESDFPVAAQSSLRVWTKVLTGIEATTECLYVVPSIAAAFQIRVSPNADPIVFGQGDGMRALKGKLKGTLVSSEKPFSLEVKNLTSGPLRFWATLSAEMPE